MINLYNDFKTIVMLNFSFTFNQSNTSKLTFLTYKTMCSLKLYESKPGKGIE